MATSAQDALGGERLKRYWTTGPGAARIGWGTPGDFTRCTQALKGKIGDEKGYCALLHRRATGMWPGDARNRK